MVAGLLLMWAAVRNSHALAFRFGQQLSSTEATRVDHGVRLFRLATQKVPNHNEVFWII